MSRPAAQPRASLAVERLGRDIDSPGSWSGARQTAAPLRLVVLPLAALLALAAGLLFVVLLPICGVASIAESLARAGWNEVRGGVPQARRDNAPQH